MKKVEPVFSEAVYGTAMALLPEQYKDRQNVAAVAGWMASAGHNVTLIARLMGRSRPWVYKRIEEAKRVFEPLLRD